MKTTTFIKLLALLANQLGVETLDAYYGSETVTTPESTQVGA